MKTVSMQERLRDVNREPLLQCPQAGIEFAETGPGQPLVLSCNHIVSTKGLAQQAAYPKILGRDGDARRCPVCKHPIPESAKVTDFMMAPHIIHEVRYPDKGFPADGPVPAPRGKGKMPSLQALQSVDHSNLLNAKGESKRLQIPIQQKRVIDDRPHAALPTNARYVDPNKTLKQRTRAEREQLLQAAKRDPDSVPYEQLKPGDLVVSKSPKELQQDATKGLERFQMYSIFSLGETKVSLGSLMPCPTAAAAPTSAAAAAVPSAAASAAAVAGGAYTAGEVQRLLGKLNWESELSMDDIQAARDREDVAEAYEALCRQTGRTHEQLQIDCLEAALERTLEVAGRNGGELVRNLNNVRADGRPSRLFVVTGVDQKTYKAEVRRVRLGNLRRLQPLRNAWAKRQMRGGATKGAVSQNTVTPVDTEIDKLGAESDHMQKLGDLLFGYNRDERWVEALLSEDDEAAAREDFDSEAGWTIYDNDSDEESEDEHN